MHGSCISLSLSLSLSLNVVKFSSEAAFDDDGRPVEPGFYTGAPAFHNVLYNIYLHTKALGSVKRSSTSSSPPNWLKREAISNIIAEELSPSQYEQLIKRLSSLVAHPNMNDNTQKLLETYHSNASGQSQVDTLRRVLETDKSTVQTVGRRKSSTAVVRVRHGTGVVTINKQPFLKYFYRAEDRQQVLYPLILTNSLQRYDINVTVQGGGLTGQQLLLSSHVPCSCTEYSPPFQVRVELHGWQ